MRNPLIGTARLRTISLLFLGLFLQSQGFGDIINPRDLPDTPVSNATQAVINESRKLREEARRNRYHNLKQAADQLLRSARGEFLMALLEGASVEELEGILEEMFVDLWVVRRNVYEVNDGDMEDLYMKLKRKMHVLQAALGEEGGGEVEPEPDPMPETTKIFVKFTVPYTYFKKSTAQSADLPYTEKCLLQAGQSVLIETPVALVGGHVPVVLAEDLPGCGFGLMGTTGYVYGPHVTF